MKNYLTNCDETHTRSQWVKVCLHLLAAGLLLLVPILLAKAQRPDGAFTVSGLSSHSVPNGTVITISADGNLSRAQTWQDRDGFHVVVPESHISDLIKSGKGIRVRRVGTSVEIILLVRQGTPVGVQTNDNRLNLIVEGKLEAGRQGDSDSKITEEMPTQRDPNSYSLPTDYAASTYSAASYPTESTLRSASTALAGRQVAEGQSPIRDSGEYRTKEEGNVTEAASQGEGVLASIFPGTSVVVLLVILVVWFLVVRKFRSNGSKLLAQEKFDKDSAKVETPQAVDQAVNPAEPDNGLVHNNHAPANNQSREPKSVVRLAVAAPASLYGAYRIDQEVGKLVLGQTHRMDVLSSRASEDRRAIQTSLIKTIVSQGSSDDERRRAREALEEYGFVARESASVLLAPDAFERTSAARTLGEIGSSAALPFLLEALYDAESIVRNQAVVSIGELKVPSAIGALLDMARKHPDVPPSLVSRALSACSVEGLGFFDAILPSASFLGSGFNDVSTFEFNELEPTSSIEELPDSLNDPELAEALTNAMSDNMVVRCEAAKILGQFQTKSSVSTLTQLTQQDAESSIRALAVSSLASIDHESVFPAVLLGMADESREVRAAAARTLSRLSFDRSDAYIRLIQTADDETLREVAQACVKAGIVSQNLDRLSNGDRRQAYEAFTLICLLAKANLTEQVIGAIEQHTNKTVRLSAVHLLASTGECSVFDELQALAVKDDMDDEVKTALLEGMYKLDRRGARKGLKPTSLCYTEPQMNLVTQEDADKSLIGSDFDVGTYND